MQLCKNVSVNGRRTSMRMDKETCSALSDICQRENMTLNALCSLIDERRKEASLTAAVRLFIMIYYRSRLEAFEKEAGIEQKETISPRVSAVLSSIQEK